MELQHLAVKLSAVEPLTCDLDHLGAVFNGWIQAQSLPELLIDVVDYRHVHHGPGVILIAHEAHYSLDHAAGRWGLLYARKARVDGSPVARLAQAMGPVVNAAQKLETETTLRFDTQTWQVSVNDRLLAPNTPESFAAIRPVLSLAFELLLGETAFSLRWAGAGRQRLTVDVSASVAVPLADLAERLAHAETGIHA